MVALIASRYWLLATPRICFLLRRYRIAVCRASETLVALDGRRESNPRHVQDRDMSTLHSVSYLQLSYQQWVLVRTDEFSHCGVRSSFHTNDQSCSFRLMGSHQHLRNLPSLVSVYSFPPFTVEARGLLFGYLSIVHRRVTVFPLFGNVDVVRRSLAYFSFRNFLLFSMCNNRSRPAAGIHSKSG